MNQFLLPSGERLAHWRDFRNSLADLPEDKQLEAVANYWANTPLVSLAYNIDDCGTWPSPWEMLHIGRWCRDSVAIGIEFTLRLAGWDPKRLTIRYINDRPNSTMRLICDVDRAKMLNYEWGRVNTYPCKNSSTLRSFQHDGKQYCEL